ncbi:MAG: prolyl aminopeptidase [Gammaproteobacteria bacterium]|nr:prolyl aminopeptidase [Gammaproteobacteria bacterium]
MCELYPELEPTIAEFLDTGDGHQVYYEVSGNSDGLPVIFLHGGPGSGAKPHHRQFFDPDRYRIVIFDQRGTGRSRPHGHLEHNTTQDLLADMESIRRQLDIDRWVVFGGSWGATLALLYAQAYPDRVSGLILRGTFLARQQDRNWMLGQGADRFFPEYWAEFVRDFDSTEPEAILDALYEGVHAEDESRQLAAARSWALWTGRVVTYTLVDEYKLEVDDPQKLVNEARIEMHYARNRYFIEENPILENMNKVPAVPARIIHGRRDMVCTPSASWTVHQALPGSELEILPDAGHLAGEPAVVDALVRATDAMADVCEQ